MWVGDLHAYDALVHVGVQGDLGGVEAFECLLNHLQQSLRTHAPAPLIMVLFAAARAWPLRGGLRRGDCRVHGSAVLGTTVIQALHLCS